MRGYLVRFIREGKSCDIFNETDFFWLQIGFLENNKKSFQFFFRLKNKETTSFSVSSSKTPKSRTNAYKLGIKVNFFRWIRYLPIFFTSSINPSSVISVQLDKKGTYNEKFDRLTKNILWLID